MDVKASQSISATKKAFCCMHLCSDQDGKVIVFQSRGWSKFLNCCLRWIKISGSREADIARKTANQLSIDLNSPNVADTPLPKDCYAGYHLGCYQTFCHVGKIQRAESRKRKCDESEGKSYSSPDLTVKKSVHGCRTRTKVKKSLHDP